MKIWDALHQGNIEGLIVLEPGSGVYGPLITIHAPKFSDARGHFIASVKAWNDSVGASEGYRLIHKKENDFSFSYEFPLTLPKDQIEHAAANIARLVHLPLMSYYTMRDKVG